MKTPHDPRVTEREGIEDVPASAGTSSRARRSPDPQLPGDARQPADIESPDLDEHEGATEEQVGDRTGPGAGYDQEPAKQKDRGGVADS